MRVTFGVAQQQIGRVSERRRIGALPAQCGFGQWIAPGLVRDAPEREAAVLDDVAIELEPDRDGNQGECVGEPVPNFQYV